MELDPWLSKNLVCPRDRQELRLASDVLACSHEHQYPVVHGIPVMLLQDVKQTHHYASRSLQQAEKKLDLKWAQQVPVRSDSVDAYVQQEIADTNGIMYTSVLGRLREYPIPTLRLPNGAGNYFLDIGCNWGRWCIAAGKLGYNPVGIDPSLEAILVARRVARQLGVQACHVVADARYLPFADTTFDLAFSYGVLQHFAKGDAYIALSEIKRVLKVGGQSMVQMPNAFGLRCLYHQIRRGFREPKDFEVRYWTMSELKSRFESLIGPPTLSVDGYLSLNPQISDIHLLPLKYRLVIMFSEALRRISLKAPLLSHLADSLYVNTHKLG